MHTRGIAGSLPRPVSQQAQLAEPEPQRGWTLNWAWGHAPASGCQARRGSRELAAPARWEVMEKSKVREPRRGVEPTQRRAPSPQGQFWLRWDLEFVWTREAGLP